MRTLIVFFALFLMTRLMGKRQIGQLQPYEFTLTLIVANLATVPMADINLPLLWGILPIYVLLAAGLVLSLLSLKFMPARRVICGKPRMLIAHGVVLEDALCAVRYTLQDLLEQLRAQGVFDPSEVYYAILETNGQISVLPKSAFRPAEAGDLTPCPQQEELHVALIMDGKIQKQNLRQFQTDEAWLNAKLIENGFACAKDILLSTFDGTTLYLHGTGRSPRVREVSCAVS
ncbi:MAG: DUF421 domain-containing protein [Clostridia bacterium]|nr:DUF421 domain-containing protein [Clostridia bacterium]